MGAGETAVDIQDRELLAELLGALEPGDAAWVGDNRTVAQRLRAAGLAACAGLAVPRALPGLAADVCAPDTLDGAPTGRVGDRLVLPLTWAGSLEQARIVVWRECEGTHERIFPRGSAWPTLAAFRQRDAQPVIDLVLAGPAGLQRYDIVLIDLVGPRWADDDPSWERLYAAGRAGGLPGCRVEIRVGEPGDG